MDIGEVLSAALVIGFVTWLAARECIASALTPSETGR
jgi:hypothetical protein